MAKRKSTTSPKKRPIEQYDHKDKERVNNPPVGLVTPESDKDLGKKKYSYDPHLDPQLQWAGKAERLSFEVDTVSLHVHERIDPRSIIEAVRKKNGSNYEQESLFKEEVPLKDAIEFYKHRHNWSNRLIAGDSLLVMNSLIEKEGLAGQVQMIYFDPPYGIKYGSNFQPFVNKRDVKDGKDDDLSGEPETIKAFRDTWELGIHSYLSYLRDRLLLARELLSESGSVFIQISDENVHHVREIMDEVFGVENFISLITFKKTAGLGAAGLPSVSDYDLWYSKDKKKFKFHQLYNDKELEEDSAYVNVEIEGERRKLNDLERQDLSILPKNARVFRNQILLSSGRTESCIFPISINGKTFNPTAGRSWATNPIGIENLIKANRIQESGTTLSYIRYVNDFPVNPMSNFWADTASGSGMGKIYVVQTSSKVIERCMLMASDPGDLVLDITCGSGTTAFVAEQWGRRWITCDTSRVAITLAKQRLMTAVYDYYELAHSNEGVGSGFKYKTVPHITLKSIANNEPPGTETLYDQPILDNKKTRVSGPFTVEAVPSPSVRSVDSSVASGERSVASSDQSPLITKHSPLQADNSIVRSGETLRQSEWRNELLKSGIRGKNGQYILFSRVEPLPGTRWLHADAETKSNDLGADRVSESKGKVNLPSAERVVISFGPEHSPLEQRQVALAIEEAQTLVPRPKIVVFASFQFDPEAAKDIDEMNWPGVTLLKVQMNPDMMTDDLKKKRSSNESFWLIGSPDVAVVSVEWLVDSYNNQIGEYAYIKKLSGLNSLVEINGLSREDLQFYAALSLSGDLFKDFDTSKVIDINKQKKQSARNKTEERVIDKVILNFENDLKQGTGVFRELISKLRENEELTEQSKSISIQPPLKTIKYFQVEVLGFDYFNTKTGNIESGGKDRIAMWMLDTDYDGMSLFPRQVFFPMAGEKEGWAKLAKNLKAEIDEELIEAYKGTVSLPFEAGKYQRIAVKIVDDRGIESLKVMGV